MNRDYHLIDGAIRIRGDNSSACVINSFTEEVLSEPTVLTLESLVKGSDTFSTLHADWKAWGF